MSDVEELTVPRAEAIARLNDALRKEGVGGILVVSLGVKAIEGFNTDDLTKAIMTYDAFNADNDLHGERDFGKFTLWGEDCFWKIDYYDIDLKFGSEDPNDADKTARVLTVMLPSEW